MSEVKKTVEEIRASVKASEDDRNVVHDVMLELIPVADLPGDLGVPDRAIDAVIDGLTDYELKGIADWGMNDTEVRDVLFARLRRDGFPADARTAIQAQKELHTQ